MVLPPVWRRAGCTGSAASKVCCTVCRSPAAGPTGATCRRRAGARSASYTGNNTMNSRDAVLTRIRQRLGRPLASIADRATVETRITSHTRGPLPVFSTDLAARFREKATSLASTVDGPMPPTAVPAAIARYLEEQKLSQRAVCWPGLTGIDWKSAGMAVEARSAREDDLTG